MMFFHDTRSIGLVFWIVVVLLIINSVIVLLGTFMDDMITVPDYVTDVQMYCLVIGVGNLISAAIYAVNAHRVMSRKNTKLEVLRNYVMTVGLCTLVGAFTEGIAEYMFTEEREIGLMITGIGIVLGIIIILIALVIANGKKSFGKKVIWAILVIAFVLLLIDALLPADNYWEYAENIAHLLISFFMLAFILDSEVKTEMGAKS